VDAGTLLFGAGIALGSAALGTCGEAAKGFIGRWVATSDKRRSFQHRTAVELQETLFEYFRTTSQIQLEEMKNFKATGQWGRHLAPDDVSD
jgi:hypothetical protein